MTDSQTFSLAVLVISAVLMAAVFSNRLSEWIRVPTPALFLIAAAGAAGLFPGLGQMTYELQERIVSIALVFILFNGGMHIGFARFRTAAGAIAWIGVAGTVVTAGAIAVAANVLFGFEWHLALLLGAALAPTDPAVVFAVLGRREISGRSSTILEGESGANDPVGIALLISLLVATGSGWAAIGTGMLEFVLQMGVGTAVGIIGGYGLVVLTRRAALPNGALVALRTVGAALFIYAAATLLHGSGFLAVFIAGIMMGDLRAPYKAEIDRFIAGIASLAEIVAFVVLGLSITISEVLAPDVLWTGLGIAALLILVIRPVLVGLVSLPIRLLPGERAFILWAGLKGAVPILLGVFILNAGVPGADRIYAIIFLVVLVSVIVQGSLVPVFASVFKVPMRMVASRPWAVEARFKEEPEGLERHVVAGGSRADGSTVAELDLGEEGWITMISRSGRLIQVTPNARLTAGDTVLTQVGADADFGHLFRADDRPRDEDDAGGVVP